MRWNGETPDSAAPPPVGLRLDVGGIAHPVRRIWPGGVALDRGAASGLRGHVELAETAPSGRRWRGLITALRIEGDELLCDFKRLAPVHDRAPAADWSPE
jgi:hypothetical protein